MGLHDDELGKDNRENPLQGHLSCRVGQSNLVRQGNLVLLVVLVVQGRFVDLDIRPILVVQLGRLVLVDQVVLLVQVLLFLRLRRRFLVDLVGQGFLEFHYHLVVLVRLGCQVILLVLQALVDLADLLVLLYLVIPLGLVSLVVLRGIRGISGRSCRQLLGSCREGLVRQLLQVHLVRHQCPARLVILVDQVGIC